MDRTKNNNRQAEEVSPSLPGDLFFARFESCSPAEAVQKDQEPCPPVITRAEVCMPFKRINPNKAEVERMLWVYIFIINTKCLNKYDLLTPGMNNCFRQSDIAKMHTYIYNEHFPVSRLILDNALSE